MKKLIAALLACALILCCAAFAEDKDFDPLRISLWSEDNAYEWTCEYSAGGVISEPMYEYIADEDGAGGTYEFYFGVNGPGKATIIFNYGVSWGIAAPIRTMICSVVVDESGRAAVRSAECFNDDDIVVVKLPCNPADGWSWNYETAEDGIVELLKEQFTPYEADIDTAGGITEYEFRVNAPGSEMLMFNYSNMWDPFAAADETFVLVAAAGKDMQISLNIEENADAQ